MKLLTSKITEDLDQNFHNSELCLQPQLIHRFFLLVSGSHSITCGAPEVFHLLCSAQPCVDMCQGREMRLSLNPPASVQRSSYCWSALTVFMMPEISLLEFMRPYTSLVSLLRFVLHKKNYTFLQLFLFSKAKICCLSSPTPFFPEKLLFRFAFSSLFQWENLS